MIVYRCISEKALADIIGIPNEITAPRGNNTFNYEENVNYKHFFYHYPSATTFMDFQNLNRYYNKYQVIMAYDLKNEILKEYFGLGQYNLKCIPNDQKDKILRYFETIYLPEFAIPSSLITKNMIVGIGDKKRITPVNYISCDEISQSIISSEQNFLEYEKWLFENNTNVSKKLVLQNSNYLFPIDSNKTKKN